MNQPNQPTNQPTNQPDEEFLLSEAPNTRNSTQAADKPTNNPLWNKLIDFIFARVQVPLPQMARPATATPFTIDCLSSNHRSKPLSCEFTVTGPQHGV
jgi:hypothetical protein